MMIVLSSIVSNKYLIKKIEAMSILLPSLRDPSHFVGPSR